MPESPTPQQVLDLPMRQNDADAATIRDYLIRLLVRLWAEGDGFSSKRPFGNSDWQWVVYEHLIVAGWVDGALDELGYIDRVDVPAADALIDSAIKALGGERRG